MQMLDLPAAKRSPASARTAMERRKWMDMCNTLYVTLGLVLHTSSRRVAGTKARTFSKTTNPTPLCVMRSNAIAFQGPLMFAQWTYVGTVSHWNGGNAATACKNSTTLKHFHRILEMKEVIIFNSVLIETWIPCRTRMMLQARDKDAADLTPPYELK